MVFAQRGCLSSDPSQRKPLLQASLSSASFGTHRSQKHAGNVVPRIILQPHVRRNGVLIVSGPAIMRSSVTCQRSGACLSDGHETTSCPLIFYSSNFTDAKSTENLFWRCTKWKVGCRREKSRRKVAALSVKKKGAYTGRKRKSERRRKGAAQGTRRERSGSEGEGTRRKRT